MSLYFLIGLFNCVIVFIPNKYVLLLFFLQLGLQRYHGVGILGFNSAEWFIADIGAILAGWVYLIINDSWQVRKQIVRL